MHGFADHLTPESCPLKHHDHHGKALTSNSLADSLTSLSLRDSKSISKISHPFYFSIRTMASAPGIPVPDLAHLATLRDEAKRQPIPAFTRANTKKLSVYEFVALFEHALTDIGFPRPLWHQVLHAYLGGDEEQAWLAGFKLTNSHHTPKSPLTWDNGLKHALLATYGASQPGKAHDYEHAKQYVEGLTQHAWNGDLVSYVVEFQRAVRHVLVHEQQGTPAGAANPTVVTNKYIQTFINSLDPELAQALEQEPIASLHEAFHAAIATGAVQSRGRTGSPGRGGGAGERSGSVDPSNRDTPRGHCAYCGLVDHMVRTCHRKDLDMRAGIKRWRHPDYEVNLARTVGGRRQ
ncbi:hypothetical protein BCR44DRAFT_369770 [Catenaria anguillulae PL171]|uniref:Retrotransposon gag domain-containing protein n=1 Tax=Catenaria anguillulae PL171 TaxID=765915 RepID=A0A1Y2H756_9FUNG|nr:hypothetical protein BCR44DRAFT_369770 [Catenaria anguillulae PL171]